MSKQNYTKYSKPDKESSKVSVAPTPAPVPEPEVAKDPIFGTIENCVRVNVREAPSTEANVLVMLESGAEIRILDDEVVHGFYKICTASGIEGYCMCEYVVLK